MAESSQVGDGANLRYHCARSVASVGVKVPIGSIRSDADAVREELGLPDRPLFVVDIPFDVPDEFPNISDTAWSNIRVMYLASKLPGAVIGLSHLGPGLYFFVGTTPCTYIKTVAVEAATDPHLSDGLLLFKGGPAGPIGSDPFLVALEVARIHDPMYVPEADPERQGWPDG